MPRTIVVGGSVAGLATALALSGIGHDVMILERDAGPTPDGAERAHTGWPRPTVPQSAHSHAFGSLGTNLLRARAPRLHAALVDAGALEIDLTARTPPGLGDIGSEPGDAQLRMLGTRRSTFDMVLRREILADPAIGSRMGVTVRGLEVTAGPSPRVRGVRTGDGEVLPADLVVDATGRRTVGSRWLSEAGVPAPQRQVRSCDITYYTRYYRMLSARPPGPLNRGFGAGGLFSHYTAVLFLGDNGTFSVSLGVLPDDAPMKALREEPGFTAAVRATPLLAPWLADGASEPISPVHAMGGLDNSLVGTVPAGTRPLAGFYPVGDAACTTNPAYGRGVSLALAHAFRLADVLAARPVVDGEQADEVAAMTQALMGPWFAEAVQNDRGRAMLWRATVAGTAPPSPPPGVITFGQVAEAAAVDATVWRRLVRVMMTLDAPASVYGDEDIRARVGAALAAGPTAPPPPGPSRGELLRTVAEATAA